MNNVVLLTSTCVALGALVGAIFALDNARRAVLRSQPELQREQEALLKLAEASITLKPGEVIYPLESQASRRQQFQRVIRQLKRNKWSPTQRSGLTARSAKSADGLATLACLLLPSADRARYSEEFRSELWMLAQVGVGSLRQLVHALGHLRSALLLGFRLRSPRRRSAAP